MGAQTYPVAAIAKLLDLTPRRVQQLSAEGIIPRAERGRYELVPAIQGYIRHLRDRSIGSDVAPDDSAKASKGRLLKAQAEAQEMKNAELRGDLVDVSEVSGVWESAISRCRARLLSIPTTAAPQVIGCSSLPELKAILESFIHDALRELSSDDGKQDDTKSDSERDAALSPASKVGRKRVGRPRKKTVAGKQRRTRTVGDSKG